MNEHDYWRASEENKDKEHSAHQSYSASSSGPLKIILCIIFWIVCLIWWLSAKSFSWFFGSIFFVLTVVCIEWLGEWLDSKSNPSEGVSISLKRIILGVLVALAFLAIIFTLMEWST
jgi:hypothetical protein